MLQLSTKQYKRIVKIIAIPWILVLLTDLILKFFFDHRLPRWITNTFLSLFIVGITSLGILYYWKGEGAQARDQSDTLRVLIVSAVFGLLLLISLWWFS